MTSEELEGHQCLRTIHLENNQLGMLVEKKLNRWDHIAHEMHIPILMSKILLKI